MPDEWACDDCGYIASSEPDDNKCPGCGSKMAKIEGIDDLIKDDSYDEDELATPLEAEDDEALWEDLRDDEKEDIPASKKAA